MFGNHWFVKMMPFQGLSGFGGGATGFAMNTGGLKEVNGTGGSKTTFGDYSIHKFTSPGTFSFDSHDEIPVDILLVAGGGSGGVDNAGGGGGGGLIDGPATLTSGSYPISIGSGGAARPGPTDDGAGSPGSNSTGFGWTALGGGRGGGWSQGTGAASGGSGGGQSCSNGGCGPSAGSATQPGQPGSPSPSRHGGNGGSAVSYFGAGGGGAGGNAGNSNPSASSSGGPAYGPVTPKYGPGIGYSNGMLAGGGTGGWDIHNGKNSTNSASNNGTPKRTDQAGEPAAPSNGGGGGHGANHNDNTSGAGGSGVCVVRYITKQ